MDLILINTILYSYSLPLIIHQPKLLCLLVFNQRMKILSALIAAVLPAYTMALTSFRVGTHLSFHQRRVSAFSTAGNPDIGASITQKRIAEMVAENKVLLFMKGSRNFPQCGFSNTAVQILSTSGVEFEVFDVFSDESVRQGIKSFSNWPTIPQLYINGEFIGGCDIMIEMFKNGELQAALQKAK